jgi:hypothetical protein
VTVYAYSIRCKPMSMRNFNPFTGYVTLLWCRDCGHIATRPRVEGCETIQLLQSRASCSRCRSRNVGVRLTYELALQGPGGFFIWELKMIATALREAGRSAQHAGDSIPHGERSEERARHSQTAAVYYRLAGIYQAEAAAREGLPMHAPPQRSEGRTSDRILSRGISATEGCEADHPLQRSD